MNRKWLVIIVAGLSAALLDAIAAIVFLEVRPAMLLKFIAMGYYGKAAMQGGTDMIIWGVLFHVIIALWWAFFFVILWERLPLMRKNLPATVVLYGLLIWVVMNLVVLPLSEVPPSPISFSSFWKSALILIAAVSLPIALIVRKAMRVKVRT